MKTGYRMVGNKAAFLILTAVILVSISHISMAAEKKEELNNEWEEVMSFKSDYEHQPTPVWCGSRAVVMAVIDPEDPGREKGRGGIVYVDVEKKKVRWITKYAGKNPFCSDDGSSVFYSSYHEELKGEESETGSLWKFDLKTGVKKKLIAASTDCMERPASPTAKIFVLARCHKESPPASALDLPGWKILTFPKDSSRDEGSPKWARGGSYLVTSAFDKNHNRSLVFYDRHGEVIREVPFNRKFPEITLTKAASDGVYFLNQNDGRLGRVSTKTWEIEDLPLHVQFDNKRGIAFDISPQGEIVFDRRDLGGSLWIQPIMGGAPTKLSVDGHAPAFSDSGEYLAFNRGNEKGWHSRLIILKRKGKMR